MKGDDYFLPQIRAGLAALLGPAGQLPRDPGAPPPDCAPAELILTGTLWQGRMSSFSDDMGTNIADVSHDTTFRFASGLAAGNGQQASGDGQHVCGDLGSDGVVDELAAAVRCTSSFPGAFEPHWVAVHGPASLFRRRGAGGRAGGRGRPGLRR